MTVALLQTDIAWGAEAANIQAAGELMQQAPGADLYVLPEMWSTGFATDPRSVAPHEDSSEALRWMVDQADARHCAISGSLAIQAADGTWRNRHYFADGRSHHLYSYDKHHLFTYGGEDQYYTPGQQHTVVPYEGMRFLLLTCYDLRFPVWSRYADDLQYDAIIVVANWPERRQPAWQLLTRARAIENQSYIIATNRVGTDPYGRYAGASVVADLNGCTLVQCRHHQVQAATVVIDPLWQQQQRERFHALDDRDKVQSVKYE
ncbi:MAG: nitrilase family protein [Prevotella sp.]|nr:nitrilase family protein [Prevotella sp.]